MSDSAEGRRIVQAAIDEVVPAPVLSAALYARFGSRGDADITNRVQLAMRREFGGHVEKAAAGPQGDVRRNGAAHHRLGTTMKIKPNDFRVREGEKVELAKWKTRVTPVYRSRRKYEAHLASDVEELSTLQKLHYAFNRHALLLIFQAMDAAGKDGSIRHVMSGVNPQGCQVFSFKHPSATELEHDFLWRSTQCLPERGRIGIFNRSYYEEVLIVRVHPEILRSQGLPDALLDEKTVWKDRYRSIVDLEKHLYRNGTTILKFFLHLSKEEQRKRFLERIDDPTKNWKLSAADMEERGFWNEYMRAYEACLGATSTDIAPWYVVPADDKDNARLIVSQIVLESLKALDMRYPEVTAQRRKELLAIRDRLRAEGPAHH